ncbi:YdbH domain-containing protein [Sphingomonas sp. RHCKR47]|uniref:intermembrane phospholipid transport protein YdbH family protein n=1 Tax=Sphingomonas citricola TaxID=2862498 RepID=UPI001C665290|nr:YdbH domain-containing protein [Sphingomonas citricola]MBW6523066.1 YdbH domain-containing protein [Sphingomonas citricola]
MSGERSDDQAKRSPASRRRARVLVAVSTLSLAAVGGVWLSRVPIATRLIDRELATKHVPARYHIEDLGFGRQRLTDVVIGDPAHPDLVADWVETRTDVGFDGPHLIGVRAGRVRVRARLVDGRVSFGALDRLIPTGSGGAPTLPSIDLSLADGAMRLETPYGIAGVSLSGSGRLDGGFTGHYALAAERLGQGDCRAGGMRAAGRVTSTGRAPRGGYGVTLDGPLRAATVVCGDAQVAAVTSALQGRVVIGDFRRSTLRARFGTGAARYAAIRAAGVSGEAALSLGQGGAAVVPLVLSAQQVRATNGSARRITLDGSVSIDAGRTAFAGKVAVQRADVSALVPRTLATGAATPITPLLARATAAATRAARDLSGNADVAATIADGVTEIAIERARVSSASGAKAVLVTRQPLRWRSDAAVAGAGTLRVGGGGLPQLVASVARGGNGGTLTGQAQVARYVAGDAAIALDRVQFRIGARAGNATARVTLSGPLPDGRVDALTLPLDLRWTGSDLRVNPACTPVAFARLRVSSLRLDPARLTLCPVGGALVERRGGGVNVAARLPATTLSGTIGGTPLRVAAAGARLSLGASGFQLDDVRARIGAATRETRIDATRLTGMLGQSGVAGGFAGLAGQIANVPLLLGDGTGTWRFANGALALAGALKVRDAAASARFNPMDARDVALTLERGAIRATGVLVEPTRGVKVADVAIDHRLSTGAGHAGLGVPGITFGDAFQPELITPLTFGVIADVRGSVSGRGDIAWSTAGVTSTGTFSTTNTALAAAFGPVGGLSGTIRFNDLLALESAPGQVATVRSINPGVPVTDGRIVYQTLPGTRIRVASGTWPFAGGTLTLEPTLLDFSDARERRLTFRVAGMEAGAFLQQFDFKNLNATGTFDGVLPMIFDASGGRIEGGRLTARSGGSLAYVGELSEKNLGFWGNYAFQMLKSLTYRNLDIGMNGPLAGEMITDVRFAGIKQGAGAKSNFLIRRLTRLPILFNIRIRAPFRGLIDSAASFYDPQRLVARNLQQLIEEQNRRTAPGALPNALPGKGATTDAPLVPPVQPSASEIVP